jgi:hypothetical protein
MSAGLGADLHACRRQVEDIVADAVMQGRAELTPDPSLSEDEAVANKQWAIVGEFDLNEEQRGQLTSQDRLRLCLQHLADFQSNAHCWACEWDIALIARSLGYQTFKRDALTNRIDWTERYDPSVPHLINVPADHSKWKPLEEAELGASGALNLNHYVLLRPDPRRLPQQQPQPQQQQEPQQARGGTTRDVRAASSGGRAKRSASQMNSSSSSSNAGPSSGAGKRLRQATA